jgi:hypothetical protein
MGDRGTIGRLSIGLAAGLLVVAVTVGLAAVAVAGAASGRAHARRHHRPPVYRGTQGAGGGFCSNRPFYTGYGSVSDSRTLRITMGEPFISQGDLLLAAITSDRQVTPPPGWSTVFATGPASSGTRLEVFDKIVGRRIPQALSFTTSTADRISGGVLDLQGVRQSHPIGASAGQVNLSSGSVMAPSVSPTSPDSLLVFLGVTQSAVKWTTPQGMKAQYFDSPRTPPVRLFIATQRWHRAAGTGGRVAGIGIAAPSIGGLIALSYPEPITCPKVKVLSHRFKPNSRGVLSVPMKCDWTERCRGWFLGAAPAPGAPPGEPIPGPEIAVSQYSIPSGQTRTVPIALTEHGRRLLKHHRTLSLFIELWTSRSNGRLVWTAPDVISSKLIAPGG